MISVYISAWSLSKYIWETDVWARQREEDIVCDSVLCRWRSPGHSPRARSLFCAAQTQPALRGESTSQSVPGLKENASPPPSQWWSSPTCGLGHARKLHICSKAYERTRTGLASFSFTHSIVLSAPPSVYSPRPLCWYHLILSQLHQPTPCPSQQKLVFFWPYACTCALSVVCFKYTSKLHIQLCINVKSQ